MTDAPLVGILCTGKTPLELSVSIHCSRKTMAVLRKYGYMPGACYTEIISEDYSRKIKHAAAALEQLAKANDLVLTFGCEGFNSGDVIPDITEAVCTGKASYFESIVCGSAGVAMTNKKTELVEKNEESEDILPESEQNEGLLSFGKLMNILRMHSLKPEPDFVPRTQKNMKFVYAPDESIPQISLLPSRATAGFLSKALVLNFPADVYSVPDVIEAIVPAIGFTVYNLSGKSASMYNSCEERLKSTSAFQEKFKNKDIVNN